MARCPHCNEGRHFDVQPILSSSGQTIGTALCCGLCNKIINVNENNSVDNLRPVLQNIWTELQIISTKLGDNF